MDAIGLMVNAIIDGFLRVTSIGGIDVRVLPGQMVTVHGRQELPGMIVPTPPRLLPSSAAGWCSAPRISPGGCWVAAG